MWKAESKVNVILRRAARDHPKEIISLPTSQKTCLFPPALFESAKHAWSSAGVKRSGALNEKIKQLFSFRGSVRSFDLAVAT